MSNIYKISQPIRPGNFASAPSDVSAGAIYWDTTAGALFVANGAAYSQLALQTNEFLTNVFRLDDNSDPTKKIAFDASVISASTTRTLKMPDANVDLGALTNSNISASAAIAYSKLNLSNSIVDADVSSSAAIARSKLSSGSANRVVVNDGSGVLSDAAAITASRALVSDSNGIPTHSATTATELGYVSGVTSAIQTQLNGKQSTSEKGQANGYASLDGSGKVPVAQLPNSVMEFQGAWDASSNTPTLADGTGNAGDVYRVSVAGTQDLGSGNITFYVGDFVIYSGSVWQRSPMADGVVSVNGSTGVVTVNAINQLTGDVTAGPASGSQSVAATIAAGAVTASKLGTVTDGVTLDQSGAGSTLEVKTGGISNAQINASAAIAYSKLNLSSSIVNADISSSAAIAYSKLNLSASIVDADIASAAAIALNKLAAVTASRALVSDASGFVSASSVTSTELGYVSGVTSAIQTQLNGKLANVVEDTTPQLGGDLDLNGKALTGVMRRGASASASVQEEYFDSLSLTASTTAVLSSFTFDSRDFKGVSIEYTLNNGNDRRKGRMELACNNAASVASSVVSLVDTSTETADVLVSWSAAVNGNNIEISYTTGAGTFAMRADCKRFRA